MISGTAVAWRRIVHDLAPPAEAQKPSAGRPPFYSAHVNRRLGYLLANRLRFTAITPNQLTLVSAVLTYAAIIGLALFKPSWPVSVSIALALLAGYALDSADGQLARLRGQSSYAGEWFDHMVDSGKVVALHLAVLISWYRFADAGKPVLLLIPIGFAAVSSVTYFGMIMADQFRARAGAVATRTAPTPAWRRLAATPTDYGVLCLALALMPATTLFTAAYALAFVASAAFLASCLSNWRREISSMDVAS
jgi:phosphatidylglycerophosphate synthase